MSEIDLSDRFPEMKPLAGSPALFTFNGCGVSLYGRGDFDQETQSYVKTLFATFLFVPLLALRSYRVVTAPEGWYFLGRVPISGRAKLFNLCVLLVIIGVGGAVGYGAYTTTPAHRARQQLAEAHRLSGAGRLVEAASGYRSVMRSQTASSPEAEAALRRLLDTGTSQASAADAARLFEIAVDTKRSLPGALAQDDLVEQAIVHARTRGASDARGALDVLDAVTRELTDDNRDAWFAARLEALERLVTRSPGDIELLSDLARVYESQDRSDDAKTLLLPHLDALGATEGARILGLILSAEDDLERALPLLQEYADRKLALFQEAERTLEQEYSRVETESIEALYKDEAPPSWYARYDRSSSTEQEEMVSRWIEQRSERDRAVARAVDTYITAARVVPVALELGMIALSRASGEADPARRRNYLETAEATFVSIQGAAGESDEYKLSLGQVQYWLGKHDEGQALLEEVLESNQRSFAALVEVAQILRMVGAEDAARDLFREGFDIASGPEERFYAAQSLALTARDLDEEIRWLRAGDPDSSEVQASLATAQGNKAVLIGDDGAARRHFQDAIAIYASMPQDSSTLNNAALTWSSLFEITGDREHLEGAMDRLRRAVDLEPDNSIVLGNAASALLTMALHDVLRHRLDLAALETIPSLDLVHYLYDNRAEQLALVEEVREHPGVQQSIEYGERALILAPMARRMYWELLEVYRLLEDEAAIGRLLQKARAAGLESATQIEQTVAYYRGEKDATYRPASEARAALARAALDRGVDGASRAVAIGELIEARLTLEILGDTGDADALVALAEEGLAVAPSFHTRGMLAAALARRAVERLQAGHPRAAEVVQRTRRSLSALYQLIAAMEADPLFRAGAAESADVQRIVLAVRKRRADFPDLTAPRYWKLVDVLGSDLAEAEARRLRSDGRGALSRDLQLLLTPASAQVALNKAWELEATGRTEEADAMVRACAALGAPMP